MNHEDHVAEHGYALDALFRRAYAPVMRQINDHGLWDWPPMELAILDIEKMPRRPKRWRAIFREVKRMPKVGDQLKYDRLCGLFGIRGSIRSHIDEHQTDWSMRVMLSEAKRRNSSSPSS